MEDSMETRSSGLARPGTISKLPQIRSNRQSMLIEPGTLTSARTTTNGANTAAKRSSVILAPGFNTSPKKASAPFASSRSNRASMLVKPGFQMTSPIIPQAEELEPESLDSIVEGHVKETQRTSDHEEDVQRGPRISDPEDDVVRRGPRPSLTDRTLETLSAVSPSPAKRRQSGFFATDSPMKPPSRTNSALGYSRPGSQLSFGGGLRSRDPPSPTKRTLPMHSRAQSSVISRTDTTSVGTSIAPKRAVSGNSAIKSTTMQPPSTTSRLSRPGTTLPKTMTTNRMSMIGSKTLGGKPENRSPIKEAFGISPTKTAPKSNLTRPSIIAARKPPTYGTSKLAGPRALHSPSDTDQSADEVIDRKVAYSSATLRNTIKQARQKIEKKPGAFVPRSIAEDDLTAFGIDMDPNSMDLQDSAHINIIKKRINMAKSEGKLNISMLCLKEMPAEVLKMYDTNDDGGPSWYESVDVIRLNAADNELAELPEQIFAVPASEDDESESRDTSTGIFAGLEAIDLHANQLVALPSSFGSLQRLTSLNLSKNKLQFSVIDVLATLPALKELRLSKNQLKGALPASIGGIQQLEILDVHGNGITELPASLGTLSALKNLDVSDNQLMSLPFEAIFDLHLVEINASRNKLCDTLIPANVPLVPYLQRLNLSTNALLSLADTKIDFPALQHLDVSNNRIAALPNMSGWQKLSFLNAEENKISAIPEGFSSLKDLTHADFGNNSLLELDESIGSMEKLSTFNIGNNPIRERRLAKITVEELKQELNVRTNGLMSPGSSRGLPTPEFSTFAQAMSWNVNGDTLDRSNTKLKTVERMDLEAIVHENVRQCILHHNQLQVIPPSLELLGGSLVSLDLSNNKLSKGSTFLESSLSLPNLQTLNLTLNGITTLDPLAQHLRAPKLATLIVTFNKIESLPANPSLTTTFPALTKLVATNNKIIALNVDSLRGLQVLDVSSNEIETLPPQLALLEGTLRTLIINGNKFRVPSWGVLEKGTEEVLKWCRRQIPRGEEGAMEAEW